MAYSEEVASQVRDLGGLLFVIWLIWAWVKATKTFIASRNAKQMAGVKDFKHDDTWGRALLDYRKARRQWIEDNQ